MTSNQFLSYLIEKERLTPETVKNIVFSDTYKNKIEKDEDSFRKVGRLLIDSGLMKKEELESEIDDFANREAAAEKDKGDLEKLYVMVVYSDEKFGSTVRKALEADGHRVIECRDAIEANDEMDRAPCDLVVAEQELTAVDGVELASMLLQNDRRLYTAVLADDPDGLHIAAHLYVEPRFVLASKHNYLKTLLPFIETISRKKTDLMNLKSDSSAGPARVDAPDARLGDWLDEIVVDYTKEGVTLFIDPAKVPRIADRHRITKSQNKLYNDFFDSVQNQLRKMRVEQIDARALEIAVWYPWRAPVKIAPPQEPTRDASAHVYKAEDGKSVLVDYTPPSGKGRHVRKQLLVREVHNAAPEFFLLENTLDRLYETKETVRKLTIAEQRDASAHIRVSNDKLEATLTLQRPYGGKPIDIEDVLKKIDELGIKRGLKRDVLREACFSGLWDREIVIARGDPAVDGENGLIIHVAEQKFAERKKAEDSVDHRIVHRMLNNVGAGETILSIEMPTTGSPGIDIFGQTIQPKPGRPVKFSAGKSAKQDSDIILGDNVELVMDGRFLVSKIDGMLQRHGKHISVMPVYEIKGNVDYSVGNVNITGAAVIHGSVLSKFEVHATGDIYIMGSVEDAIINSGGSVFIEEGVYGHEKGIVLAQGNVETRTIEQANVFARGSVEAQSNISHSLVVAYNTISVNGQKGFAVGGSLKAGLGITVPRLGGPSHTATYAEVGSLLSIEEELAKLRETMLKRIAINEMQSRAASSQQKDKKEKQEPAESGADPKDKEEDSKKYGGVRVKQYDRYFLDWIEKYVKENKGKRSVYKPGENFGRNRIISNQLTYPGVQMRIRGLNLSIMNECVGKRVFSISGDKISESV